MPGYDDAAIKVDRVSMKFGQTVAVREVSLAVPKGTIFGLVGSDGAGKSTLLRLIAMLLRPVSGTILVADMDTVKEKKRIKPLIGYMPQRFGLYQDLTVAENMSFFMDIFNIYGAERQARRDRYLGFSNLLPFLDRPAGNLSGGMKQKLGLACVLVHEPRVLILDEPTNGVDPISRREFWDILMEMRKNGMTIVVSTAYLDEGEMCDRLALMHRARILAIGTPAEIRSSYPSLEEATIQRIQELEEELSDEKHEP
jgi:ABC-2 type transport system ATP-binding protein